MASVTFWVYFIFGFLALIVILIGVWAILKTRKQKISDSDWKKINSEFKIVLYSFSSIAFTFGVILLLLELIFFRFTFSLILLLISLLSFLLSFIINIIKIVRKKNNLNILIKILYSLGTLFLFLAIFLN